MNGEPEFLLGISQDITEQLEAKARLEQAHLELERRVAERTDELRVVNEQLGRRLIELEEAEEKFRLAIESAPNAMVMADETGRIVLVNAEAERMFGFSREELLGKSAGSLLQDGALDLSFVLKKHAKGPNNQRIALVDDLCARRTDGKIFPIEIGLNPIAIHQGNYVLMAIVDVTDRKAAEEFMRRSLREKDLLLKEIHHRVKNNMQVISSLLKLQGSYLPNEELRRLFKQSDDRVRSMALIHERLYRSEGFDDIDFSGYIRELAEHLFHSYVMDSTRVELKLELEPTLLGIDQAIPCGLMLNEMVTNSLKHAFGVEGKGYVLIRLGNSAEGEILLQVQDNGVGLPNDFDLGRPNSFGMEIVRTLCEQLSGTLDVQGKDGTNLTLRFRRIDHPERRREFDSHSDRKGKSPLTEPLPG